MSSIKQVPDSLLIYLASADGSRHVALIVTQGSNDDEKIVGEGRFVISNERRDVADIALLVVDEFQRQGIAMHLIHRLMEIARCRGVTRFSADVLADNRAMLSLLDNKFQRLSSVVSSGVIHCEFPVTESLLHIYGKVMTSSPC